MPTAVLPWRTAGALCCSLPPTWWAAWGVLCGAGGGRSAGVKSLPASPLQVLLKVHALPVLDPFTALSFQVSAQILFP